MTTPKVDIEEVAAYVFMLVKDYVRVYNCRSVSAINDGMCGDFADDLMMQFPEVTELCSTPHGIFEFTGNFPAHFWVRVNGEVYVDAEAPWGVADWRDLQFFKRAILSRSPQERRAFSVSVDQFPSCLVPNP